MTNRVIKFRGWDGERMSYDIGVFEGCAIDRASKTYDTPNTEIDWQRGTIPMQFTGLLDKNGKEIFEGDIVKSRTSYPLEVFWGKYGWSIRFVDFQGGNGEVVKAQADDSIFEEKLEVIGNIYENPELLK